jgi:hypothetical protein
MASAPIWLSTKLGSKRVSAESRPATGASQGGCETAGAKMQSRGLRRGMTVLPLLTSADELID